MYALETERGLTLVDGGWAIAEARDLLESCLKEIGYGFGDVTHFLVTHVHRDHYTLASVIAREFGAHVSLGAGERATSTRCTRPAATRTRRWTCCGSAGALAIAERGPRRPASAGPT